MSLRFSMNSLPTLNAILIQIILFLTWHLKTKNFTVEKICWICDIFTNNKDWMIILPEIHRVYIAKKSGNRPSELNRKKLHYDGRLFFHTPTLKASSGADPRRLTLFWSCKKMPKQRELKWITSGECRTEIGVNLACCSKNKKYDGKSVCRGRSIGRALELRYLKTSNNVHDIDYYTYLLCCCCCWLVLSLIIFSWNHYWLFNFENFHSNFCFSFSRRITVRKISWFFHLFGLSFHHQVFLSIFLPLWSVLFCLFLNCFHLRTHKKKWKNPPK